MQHEEALEFVFSFSMRPRVTILNNNTEKKRRDLAQKKKTEQITRESFLVIESLKPIIGPRKPIFSRFLIDVSNSFKLPSRSFDDSYRCCFSPNLIIVAHFLIRRNLFCSIIW